MGRIKYTLVAGTALAALAGCGSSGDAAAEPGTVASGRVIDVTMVDNAFRPGQVTVKGGEPVTFRFHNTGTERHEAVVGAVATQEEHDRAMQGAAGPAAPGTTGGAMGMDHHGATTAGPGPTSTAMGAHAHGAHGHQGQGNTVTVDPGGTGELTHTFTRGETVVIGCHQPGHWAAGMRLDIAVT